jgi:hypothetical protein
MVLGQSSETLLAALKLIQAIKPLVDNPKNVEQAIAGLEQAHETIKRGKEATAKIDDLRLATQKHEDLKSKSEIASRIAKYDQERLAEDLEKIKLERVALAQEKAEFTQEKILHTKAVEAVTFRENAITDREDKLAVMEVEVEKLKNTYAERVRILNTLPGDK